MKMKLSFLLIFIAHSLWAQTTELVNAVKQVDHLLISPMDPMPPQCGETKSTALLECECEKEKTSDSSLELSIYSFNSIQELPPSLKHLALISNMPENGPIKILIGMSNDIVFTPTGVIGMIADPGIANSADPEFDVGYTHGTHFEVSQTRKDGITYSLLGRSDLYTIIDHQAPLVLDEKGEQRIPTFFTEDNVFSFVIDNRTSPQLLQWKAALGIRTLNSDHLSKIGASGQQEAFHKYYKAQGDQNLHLYQSDGQGVQVSPFLDLGIGLAKVIHNNGSCQLRLSGLLETRIFKNYDKLSTLKHHLNLDTLIRFKKAVGHIRVGTQTTIHKGGVEFTPIVSLAYTRRRYGIETSVRMPFGKLENSMTYNYENSPTNSLSLYYFIGAGKSSKNKPR
jgi:hypothetical protein